MEISRTDALIIGGGLAGLFAAKFLSLPSGMKAMILKNGSGASPFVHGFSAVLHKEDSVDRFIEDTMKSGSQICDRELVEKLCSESAGIVHLLEDEGISFKKKPDGSYDLLRPLGASWPRVVCTEHSAGPVIMASVRKELASRSDFQISNNIRALRLMVRDGAVKGALAYDKERKRFVFIETSAVILASGGFCRIYPSSTNTADIGGDGIAMAYEAGAVLADMEFVQFEPAVSVYPPQLKGKGLITTMFFDGAVLKNADGERFMLNNSPEAERVNKDVLSACIFREIKEGRGTRHGGVFYDATGVDGELLKRAYHIYVRRYADYGIDISEEPVEVAPAPHTSLGGVLISLDCSTGIKGLFACGEIAGGIHGANRIGGNAGLETLVFGRQAGISAGRWLQGCTVMNGEIGKETGTIVTHTKDAGTIVTHTKEGELREWFAGIAGAAFADIDVLNGSINGSINDKISDNISNKNNGNISNNINNISGSDSYELIEKDSRGSAFSDGCNEYEAEIRRKMEEILSTELNVLRNGKGLESAARELAGLYNEVLAKGYTGSGSGSGTGSGIGSGTGTGTGIGIGAGSRNGCETRTGSVGSPHEMYCRIRLLNDITAAKLLALSALARKESTGCHIREEAAGREAGDGKYSVRVSKTSEGPKITFSKI